MKKLTVLLGAWLCLAVPSFGVLWTGTITGVAEDGMPIFWDWFEEGETWSAQYRYLAGDVRNVSRSDGALEVIGLTGAAIYFSWMGGDPDRDFNWPSIQVEDGKVTSFYWSSNWTTTIVYFDNGSGSWDVDEGRGGGSVTITDPIAVSETGHSFPLLSIALLGLISIRRAERRLADSPSYST